MTRRNNAPSGQSITTLYTANAGMGASDLSRQEFYAVQSRQFVDDAFDGSLPAFIAAFTRRKNLSVEEAAEIHRMIDDAVEKG